ncbi:site-specific DNA-methyltransferase [Candidatus Thorarchaeota archaeon]|nr:MAG: site-specific DNA-methyltransferase [Candidatus Thorarchaeota archaeon]
MTHHLIVLGDSKSMKELKDRSVHLVVTSPPYWRLKDYGNDAGVGQQPSSYSDYLNSLTEVFEECVRVLTPDGKLTVNIMPILLSGKESKFKRRITKTVLTDLESFFSSLGNMYFHSLYIWDKRKAVRFSSWGSYPHPPNLLSSYPYEWIIVFSKAGRRPRVSSATKEASAITHSEFTNWVQNSIWDFQPASAKAEKHPAPFPEELPRRCIRLYSFAGDTVLDPFAGSGTTLRVARELGRNSVGYEINPEYEAVILRKVSTASGEDDDMIEVIRR